MRMHMQTKLTFQLTTERDDLIKRPPLNTEASEDELSASQLSTEELDEHFIKNDPDLFPVTYDKHYS